MQESRHIMGMNVTLNILDSFVDQGTLDTIFNYFVEVEDQFSTFKPTSEISSINRGEVPEDDYSLDMLEVFRLGQMTKDETNGYFDIKRPNGQIDTAGIVKGWAIQNAAEILLMNGFKNFFVDAGGDIQSHGKNEDGNEWSFGIQNPLDLSQIVKVVYPHEHGIATSGTYRRGQHIYNPHNPEETFEDILSLTVIGKNVLEADRFATAAFAMGRDGIFFIEQQPELEAYAIDSNGIATMTSQFERFTTTL